MEIASIVATLALLEYFVLVMLTGQARGRYGVAAPSTVGSAPFERYFRAQMNTIEQLVIFLPAIFLFSWYVSDSWAGILGAVFIAGRALYARGYVSDPAKRGPGFGLTLLANATLLLGAMVGALRAWL